MINHNALQSRLQAVKNGQPIPEPPMAPQSMVAPPSPKTVALKQFFITEGYKFFNVLAASVLYGYGIKAIFSTDWNFMGLLGVGFLLNHSLTILLKLIKK